MSTNPSFIPAGPLVRPPTPPRVPRKRHPIRTALFAMLGLALAIVALLLLTQPKLAALMERQLREPFLSQELKNALYLQDLATTTVQVHTQGPMHFITDPMPGVLVSVDTRAAYADILHTRTGYEVRTAKDVVYRDAQTLQGISRSPDGRYMAVSRMSTTTTVGTASSTPASSAWSIVLIDTVQKTTREIGLGVTPLFLDGTRLIYVRSTGMVSYDVVTGTEKVLSDHAFGMDGKGRGISSPDRLRLGWIDTVSKEITIYKVDTGNAEVLATIPISDQDSAYALGDEGLYVLRKGREGQMEVWYGGYGATLARVITLPAQLGITRLGIGAI